MHDFRIRVQLWSPPHSFKQFGLIGSHAFDQSHAKCHLFLQKSIFAMCRTPWITTSEVAVIVQDTIYMYVEFPCCCLFNFVGVFNFAQWNAALACARNWWAVGRRFAGLEKEEKKLTVFCFFLLSSHMHTGECALRCPAVKSREIKTWVWVMSLPAWQEAAV